MGSPSVAKVDDDPGLGGRGSTPSGQTTLPGVGAEEALKTARAVYPGAGDYTGARSVAPPAPSDRRPRVAPGLPQQQGLVYMDGDTFYADSDDADSLFGGFGGSGGGSFLRTLLLMKLLQGNRPRRRPREQVVVVPGPYAGSGGYYPGS